MAPDPAPGARSGRSGKRGEPLVIFAVLLLGWAGLRGLTWEWFSMPQTPAGPQAAGQWSAKPPYVAAGPIPAPNLWVPQGWPLATTGWGGPGKAQPLPSPIVTPVIQPLRPEALPPVVPMHDLLGPTRGQAAPAQQILYLSAMADLPLPLGMEKYVRSRLRDAPVAERKGGLIAALGSIRRKPAGDAPVAARSAPPLPQQRETAARRWSGDAWLLMRQGGNSHGLAGGSAPYGPTYGANQIGAVLRYRLVPDDAHGLSAYVRTYGALNGTGEKEAAVGLSLRPVPALPLIVMAEMRASQFQSGQTHPRPALGVVTALAPMHLGGGLEAETYVQAGYVGGAAATPFVDGQMRVEEVINHGGSSELRIGLGLWSGAQKGADRLDIGPTMRIGLHGGRASARLAIDYRLRVTGNAMPASGPAVTLSAGF